MSPKDEQTRNPGNEEAYKRYHAAVWPDVLKTIWACNIRNDSLLSRKPVGCVESPLGRACRLAIPGYHCPQKSLAENRNVLIATPLQPTQLRETDTIHYPF